MKTFYTDDEKFVRRINKFRKYCLNQRVLEAHWAVVEKITIKIKTIGIPNIEKNSKKRREDVKDVAAEKTNDGEIMGGEFGLCFLDSTDLTRDDIKEICSIIDPKSFDAEKQERDEEGDGDEIGEVLTTSPIKDAAIKVQGEAGRKLKVDKADKTAIDEAVKKLLELKGEFKTITGGDWKPTDQKKEVKGKENKAPAPTSVKDGEKSETQKKREAKKANKKADEGGSKEDAKDDGPDVSNGK